MKRLTKNALCLAFLLSISFGSILLGFNSSESLSPTVGVVAILQDNDVKVKWVDPKDAKLFRNDDGISNGGIGVNSGDHKTVLGVAHKVPASLYSMSWITMKDNVNYNTINIFVFDLDINGKPTSNILFSAMGVPNKDKEWCSYNFELPVDAPNGFLIGVSINGTGNVAIGFDSGQSSEYPFVANVNYFAGDYTAGFSSLDLQGFKSNIMIRATGIEMSGGESQFTNFACKPFMRKDDNSVAIETIKVPSFNTASQKSMGNEEILGYELWRLKSGDEKDESKWQVLTTDKIVTKEYDDMNWSGLSQGCYKYAVKAVYNSGLSVAAFSNMLAKNMLTDVNVKVNTNSLSVIPEGAKVVLKNKDGNLTHTYIGLVDNTGKAYLSGVWKGIYDVEISMSGFESLNINNLDLSSNDNYEIGDYILTEILEKPYNLTISKTSAPKERLFEWNVVDFIGDDFEGHNNFAINSPGSVKWSYIDGDKSQTYGIENVLFDNMFNEMAYIVFNPSQTTPPMSQILAALPHSGLKYLASFANMPISSGSVSPQNDDFFISPELDYSDDFELRFWAKSYLPDFVEKFNVGYSITGKNKADFKNWITASAISAPTEWTEFKYVIPANAKYVTIQCVSTDCFIFMLDDVYIGPKDSEAIVQKYEIYLDDIKISESKETSYTFDKLSLGKHKASVKSIFLTGETECVNIEFIVDDEYFKVKGLVKDNDDVLIVDSEVKITGPNQYITKTNNYGEFEIPEVFVGNGYTLSITKGGLATYTKKFDVVDSDIIMDDIRLADIPMKPGAVVANGNDANVNISWLDPTEMITFRRDSGVPTGGLGSNIGTPETVVGAIYNTPTVLHNMSWMTAKEEECTVNIFVFDLKPTGEPSTTVLFQKEVYNKGLTFNTYTFEEPIHCPNGFMLGLSGVLPGNVAVACDSGTDINWPFVSNVNYLAMDYTSTSGGFASLDKSFPRNLMLRGEGLVIYDDGNVGACNDSKSLIGYKVWRLKEGQESKPSEWIAITESQITSTSCNDNGWENLLPGNYRYAVIAVYSDDIISEPSLSNVIVKESATSVIVKVKTNATPDTAKGASVQLQDKMGTYTYNATVDVDGNAIFSKVQKGIYNIVIRLAGFGILNIVDMDFSTSNSYVIGPFTLKEMLISPTELDVVKENTNFERLFSWKWEGSESKSSSVDLYSNGFVTYEIFVNDIKVGETADKFYRIKDLKHGKNSAGVRIRTTQGVSEIVSIEFDVEEKPNGIDDVENKEIIKVYPNPVTGKYINVEGKNIEQLFIYDGVGKLIKSLSGESNIDVSELSNGIYFIKVYSNNNASICKFIINR